MVSPRKTNRMTSRVRKVHEILSAPGFLKEGTPFTASSLSRRLVAAGSLPMAEAMPSTVRSALEELITRPVMNGQEVKHG
jgi:hypothetical protein